MTKADIEARLVEVGANLPCARCGGKETEVLILPADAALSVCPLAVGCVNCGHFWFHSTGLLSKAAKPPTKEDWPWPMRKPVE